LPNETSALRLVWQAGDRRSLSAGSMATLYPERDTGAVAKLNTGD
jgi:hypothetical protein